MRINILLAWSVFCLACTTQAQDAEQASPPKRLSYHNRLSTGILAGGEYGLVTGSVTTVHGIAAGSWTVGVGVGIEGYERWRTVPVFGSLSCHFRGAKASGVFLRFNAGHAFGRLLKTQDGIDIGKTKGGPMINPMVGYQISANKFIVSLSAGYKRQRMSGNYKNIFDDSFNYRIEETMERFFFQLGLGIL